MLTTGRAALADLAGHGEPCPSRDPAADVASYHLAPPCLLEVVRHSVNPAARTGLAVPRTRFK